MSEVRCTAAVQRASGPLVTRALAAHVTTQLPRTRAACLALKVSWQPGAARLPDCPRYPSPPPLVGETPVITLCKVVIVSRLAGNHRCLWAAETQANKQRWCRLPLPPLLPAAASKRYQQHGVLLHSPQRPAKCGHGPFLCSPPLLTSSFPSHPFQNLLAGRWHTLLNRRICLQAGSCLASRLSGRVPWRAAPAPLVPGCSEEEYTPRSQVTRSKSTPSISNCTGNPLAGGSCL